MLIVDTFQRENAHLYFKSRMYAKCTQMYTNQIKTKKKYSEKVTLYGTAKAFL